MKESKCHSSVIVCCIDDFQGREKKYVILSLVVKDGPTIGFLNVANRVVVAMSRAKFGLFILGNLEKLSTSQSPIWLHVKHILKGGSKHLTLICDQHENQQLNVIKASDFPTDGYFCLKKCDQKMKCGHRCEMRCMGRQCKHSTLCRFRVPITLECNHEKKVSCSTQKKNTSAMFVTRHLYLVKKIQVLLVEHFQATTKGTSLYINVQLQLLDFFLNLFIYDVAL